MGRSGGGGGGFSGGGFGGGHNTGGFSGGGRSSGGFSGGSFGGSSGGYNNNHNSSYGYGYNPFFGRRRHYGGYGYGRGGCSGFGIALIVVICIFVVLALVSSNSGVQQSTKKRIPLTGVVEKTDWYKDEPGWIASKNVLIGGMEEFYQQTGVQPYVIIYKYDASLWNDDGTLNPDKADSVLEKFYKENFNDEAHFIFAYFQCEDDSKSEMDGEFRYLSGYAADTIMDSEAIDIFWGYFEINYYDTSLTLEQMMSDTFEKTSNNIMGKQSSNKLAINADVKEFIIFFAVGIAVIAAVVITVVVVKKNKKDKEDENPV